MAPFDRNTWHELTEIASNVVVYDHCMEIFVNGSLRESKKTPNVYWVSWENELLRVKFNKSTDPDGGSTHGYLSLNKVIELQDKRASNK